MMKYMTTALLVLAAAVLNLGAAPAEPQISAPAAPKAEVKAAPKAPACKKADPCKTVPVCGNASKCGKAGTCRFRLADLPPKAHLRFVVTPIECFGKKGAPITSGVFET